MKHQYKIAIDLFHSFEWQDPDLYKGFTVGKGKTLYWFISNVRPLSSQTKTVAVYRSTPHGLIRRYIPVDAPITLVKL